MWKYHFWRICRFNAELAFYKSSVGSSEEFIRKIESIATYYRGRTTFTELMNMPLSYIDTLYRIAEERIKTEEGKKQLEAEAIEDEMEAAMTWTHSNL